MDNEVSEIVFFNPEYVYYVLYTWFFSGSSESNTATTSEEATAGSGSIVGDEADEIGGDGVASGGSGSEAGIAPEFAADTIEIPLSSDRVEVVAPADAITLWDVFTASIVVVSLILLVGIVYSVIRMSQIRRQVKLAFETHSKQGVRNAETQTPKEAIAHVQNTQQNKKWGNILLDAESDDPMRWKLAIREADILLDVSLTRNGAKGDSIIERITNLPSIEQSIKERAIHGHKEWLRIQQNKDEILTKANTKEITDLYKPLLVYLGEI